jgi:hypothetical protein
MRLPGEPCYLEVVSGLQAATLAEYQATLAAVLAPLHPPCAAGGGGQASGGAAGRKAWPLGPHYAIQIGVPQSSELGAHLLALAGLLLGGGRGVDILACHCRLEGLQLKHVGAKAAAADAAAAAEAAAAEAAAAAPEPAPAAAGEKDREPGDVGAAATAAPHRGQGGGGGEGSAAGVRKQARKRGSGKPRPDAVREFFWALEKASPPIPWAGGKSGGSSCGGRLGYGDCRGNGRDGQTRAGACGRGAGGGSPLDAMTWLGQERAVLIVCIPEGLTRYEQLRAEHVQAAFCGELEVGAAQRQGLLRHESEARAAAAAAAAERAAAEEKKAEQADEQAAAGPPRKRARRLDGRGAGGGQGGGGKKEGGRASCAGVSSGGASAQLLPANMQWLKAYMGEDVPPAVQRQRTQEARRARAEQRSFRTLAEGAGQEAEAGERPPAVAQRQEREWPQRLKLRDEGKVQAHAPQKVQQQRQRLVRQRHQHEEQAERELWQQEKRERKQDELQQRAEQQQQQRERLQQERRVERGAKSPQQRQQQEEQAEGKKRWRSDGEVLLDDAHCAMRQKLHAKARADMPGLGRHPWAAAGGAVRVGAAAPRLSLRERFPDPVERKQHVQRLRWGGPAQPVAGLPRWLQGPAQAQPASEQWQQGIPATGAHIAAAAPPAAVLHLPLLQGRAAQPKRAPPPAAGSSGSGPFPAASGKPSLCSCGASDSVAAGQVAAANGTAGALAAANEEASAGRGRAMARPPRQQEQQQEQKQQLEQKQKQEQQPQQPEKQQPQQRLQQQPEQLQKQWQQQGRPSGQRKLQLQKEQQQKNPAASDKAASAFDRKDGSSTSGSGSSGSSSGSSSGGYRSPGSANQGTAVRVVKQRRATGAGGPATAHVARGQEPATEAQQAAEVGWGVGWQAQGWRVPVHAGQGRFGNTPVALQAFAEHQNTDNRPPPGLLCLLSARSSDHPHSTRSPP